MANVINIIIEIMKKKLRIRSRWLNTWRFYYFQFIRNIWNIWIHCLSGCDDWVCWVKSICTEIFSLWYSWIWTSLVFVLWICWSCLCHHIRQSWLRLELILMIFMRRWYNASVLGLVVVWEMSWLLAAWSNWKIVMGLSRVFKLLWLW